MALAFRFNFITVKITNGSNSYRCRYPSSNLHFFIVLLNAGESVTYAKTQHSHERTLSGDPPLEAFEDVFPNGFLFPTLTRPNQIPTVIKIPATTTVKPAPKNPAPTGLTFPPHLIPVSKFTLYCRNWQPRELLFPHIVHHSGKVATPSGVRLLTKIWTGTSPEDEPMIP